MALTDTARLVASLELQDKFSKPLGNANRGLDTFDRRLQASQRAAQGASRAIGTALRIGVGAAAAGAALIAVNITKGVQSLNELEQVTTATNTVIESTAGIAGQTAGEIRGMSEAFEDLNATMDDKVIQSGANLLLTFTNIREDAFEPALEAALNMNEAMGGGPDGLQTAIIQVGKALNDPIKGIGALRRVGVQLSAQQEEQVRTLVEQNDLYGAQEVILGELSTQFGGRFAAAGRTAEGRMAALGDRIEDLQQSLAGPLIPVINRVRERLIDLLGSRQAREGARELGEAIAGIFTDRRIEAGVDLIQDAIARVTEFLEGGGTKKGGGLSSIATHIGTIASEVGRLPWESIGNAAKLLGTGSKALLDAFLGLPPWVQTAVLTSWGLNKLTGGLLGDLFSTLATGLIKGVLGINAGVVNIKAGAVVGGPGGTPTPGGGGRGGFGRGLVGGLAAGAGTLLASEAAVMTVQAVNAATAQGEGIRATLESIDTKTKAGAIEKLQKIDDSVQAVEDSALANFFGLDDRLRGGFADERAELVRQVGTLNANETRRHSLTIAGQREAATRQVTQLQRINADEARRASTAHSRLQDIRNQEAESNRKLEIIKNKRTSFHINNTINNTVDVELSTTAALISFRRVTSSTGNQQDFEILT